MDIEKLKIDAENGDAEAQCGSIATALILPKTQTRA